ncbi:MAG: type II toxin-antitoxin system VapC family toxin [Dactylosporangium sp.]|nr:type II toxin-antitoxin system VapC family toxin [Dactylosporangium sp.]NNJ59736.1 type II toxin-antitoxin system VapC family toxin [Dactylosporangium sp.]
MAFLLDTNVVSELRKVNPNAGVLSWYHDHADAEVFLSCLVLGEIRQGIERLRRRHSPKADLLEQWVVGLLSTYHDRILPVTAEIAEVWGQLNVPPSPPPVVDGLMAATAKVHRLTLATRNVSDVVRTGVRLVNPFTPT